MRGKLLITGLILGLVGIGWYLHYRNGLPAAQSKRLQAIPAKASTVPVLPLAQPTASNTKALTKTERKPENSPGAYARAKTPPNFNQRLR